MHQINLSLAHENFNIKHVQHQLYETLEQQHEKMHKTQRAGPW